MFPFVPLGEDETDCFRTSSDRNLLEVIQSNVLEALGKHKNKAMAMDDTNNSVFVEYGPIKWNR